jgi:hypothetical protein
MVTDDRTHAVKVRLAGAKRWEFLRPNGGTTHLRLHALVVPEEQAKSIAAEVAQNNPDVVEAAKAVQW